MKIGFLCLVLGWTAPAFAQDPGCVHTRTAFRCVKYLRNYDGDTVTIEIKDVHPLFGENISVRVRGIDTPEVKGRLPCEREAAKVARRFVESQLKNAKRIDVVDVARDKYFRILGDLIADGKNVGELLIKNHLAYRYNGGTKEKLDWCRYAR